MLDLLAGLDGKIAGLDKEIARCAREDKVSRRLMTVPDLVTPEEQPRAITSCTQGAAHRARYRGSLRTPGR